MWILWGGSQWMRCGGCRLQTQRSARTSSAGFRQAMEASSSEGPAGGYSLLRCISAGCHLSWHYKRWPAGDERIPLSQRSSDIWLPDRWCSNVQHACRFAYLHKQLNAAFCRLHSARSWIDAACNYLQGLQIQFESSCAGHALW